MKTSRIIILLSVLSTVSLIAQNRNDITGLGMGRSSVASSAGIDAMWSNPANLIVTDTTAKAFSISLSPVGAMAGNSIMSMNDLKFYFGGVKSATGKTTARTLTDSERDAFLSKLSEGIIAGSVNVSGLAFLYVLSPTSTIGFSHNTTAEFQANIPSGVADIVAGYTGFKPLSIQNTTANAIVYNSYQVSFASVIKNAEHGSQQSTVQIGVNAKYLQGLYYAEAGSANSIVVTPYVPTGWDSTKNWDVVINTSTRSAGIANATEFTPTSLLYSSNPSGSGVGFDLGTTITLPNVFESPLLVSASLTDVGFISWSNGTYNTTVAHDTIKAVAQLDESFLDRYQPTTKTQAFTTALSTRFRIGVSAMFNDVISQTENIRCAVEYTQGFNMVGVNTTIPRISAGAELLQHGFRPALRLGAQLGGIEGSMITAGFGWNILNTVAFDVAIGSLQTVFSPKTTKWVDGGFRLRVDL